MKGTLLKPIGVIAEFGEYMSNYAREWFEKYWLVDTNLALDEAWRREHEYGDGRSAPNVTIPELIEQGFLDAHEVDEAITEWLNLPWTEVRFGSKYHALHATSVEVVLGTIARMKTLVLARKTLCDRLPILLAWVDASPCCRNRVDWMRMWLLDTVMRLPERKGRYVELYRERLETVDPDNYDYFAVVFAPGGVWDKARALTYLNSLGQLLRRRRANCFHEAEADLRRVSRDVRKKYCARLVEERLAEFDKDVVSGLWRLFYIVWHGQYDPALGRFVPIWAHTMPSDEWGRLRDDTTERVRRFIIAQNVFAPLRH